MRSFLEHKVGIHLDKDTSPMHTYLHLVTDLPTGMVLEPLRKPKYKTEWNTGQACEDPFKHGIGIESMVLYNPKVKPCTVR